MMVKLFLIVIILSNLILLVALNITKSGVRSQFARIYYPQNVHLFVDFPQKLETRRFDGRVEIHFALSMNTGQVVLNANVLEIQEVDLSFGTESIYQSHEYDTDKGLLLINSREELSASNIYVVNVKYIGEIRTDHTGFYIVPYLNQKLETEYMLATKFKPNYARRALPCFDEPESRPLIVLSVTHWKGFTAVSNTQQESRERVDVDIIRTTFQRTQTLPIYHLSLTLVAAPSSGMVSSIDYIIHGFNNCRLLFTLNISTLFRDKMWEYIYKGIPPKKFDILAMPTDDANIVSDDNWCVATFPEKDLEFHDSEKTAIEQMQIVLRIGRAMSHHYFGAHITPAAWSDLWLSDGLANWLAYKIANQILPELDVEQFFMVFEYQEAMRLESDVPSVPIVPPYSEDTEVPVYSPALSAKSACFTRMLDHAFTAKYFQESIKKYSDNSRSVSSDFFLQTCTDSTPLNNIKPDYLWFWLNQTGYPVINVTRNYTTGSVYLTQGSFTKPNEQMGWWIPFNIVPANTANFDQTNVNHVLNPWVYEGIIDVSSTYWTNEEWIVLNSQQTGFHRTNYDMNNWNLLIEALITDHTIIHVNNRAQLLEDAYKLAENYMLPFNVSLHLATYLKREEDFAPWVTASRFFTTLKQLLGDEEESSEYRYYVRELTRPLFAELGLKENSNDAITLKAIRGIITSGACLSWNEDCYCQAKILFREYIINNKPVSPNIRYAVLCTGLESATWKELELARRKLLRSKNAIERKELIHMLGCSNNAEFLIELIEQVLTLDPPVDFSKHERHHFIPKIVDKGKATVSAATRVLMNSTFREILLNEDVLLEALDSISQFIFTQNQAESFYRLLNDSLSSKDVSKSEYERFTNRVRENLNRVEKYQGEILKWLHEFKEEHMTGKLETEGPSVCQDDFCGCGCACEGDFSSNIHPAIAVYLFAVVSNFLNF